MSECKKGDKNPNFGKDFSGKNGPNFGKRYTDEEKLKMSLITKGIPKSEEWKRKASIVKMGERNPNFGKPTWLKGKHLSEETKRKISSSEKGKIISEGTRKKISESHKGKIPWMNGKKHTEETKQKISNSLKGNTHLKDNITLETREKMRAAKIGIKITKEHKEKISIAKKHDIKNTERLRKILIIKPTKPQLKLLDKIQYIYPNESVVMEYSFKTSNNRLFFIDVAIPNLKIGFEYDEPYWHKNKEKDLERHNLIESHGWKLIHFNNLEFCKLRGDEIG